MSSYTQTDAVETVYRMLKDTGPDSDSQLLTDTEIGIALSLALTRYGRVLPLQTTEDVASDGTTTLALPDGWVDDESRLIALESPIGDDPPSFMDPRAYALYRSPDGITIRWLDQTYLPASGDNVRVTYTCNRVFGATSDDTTVRDVDYPPLCALAAAYGAESIAAKYAREHEPLLGVDSTTGRTRSQEWQSIASRFRGMWDAHAKAVALPATARINWDCRMTMGYDWLTHGRRMR